MERGRRSPMGRLFRNEYSLLVPIQGTVKGCMHTRTVASFMALFSLVRGYNSSAHPIISLDPAILRQKKEGYTPSSINPAPFAETLHPRPQKSNTPTQRAPKTASSHVTRRPPTPITHPHWRYCPATAIPPFFTRKTSRDSSTKASACDFSQ